MAFPTTTLLDSLKREETPLSNGGKWSTLGWVTKKGTDTGELFGWTRDAAAEEGAEESASRAEGAYWNVVPFENPAVSLRQYKEANASYTGIWACTTGEGTRNGYRLKIKWVKPETVAMTLERWVGGVRTELATAEVKIAMTNHETAFGLTVLGGVIKGWYGDTEAEMTVRLEAEDATFTSGKVGIENNEANADGATDFRAASQVAGHSHTLTSSQPQKASTSHSLTTKRSASQAQSASLTGLGAHEHTPEASQQSSASLTTSRPVLTATAASSATLAKAVSRTLLLTNAPRAIPLRVPRKEPLEGSGSLIAEGTGVLSWKHQPLTGDGEARFVGVGFLTFAVTPDPVPPTFRDVWFYGAALRRELPGSGEAIASGDSVLAT